MKILRSLVRNVLRQGACGRTSERQMGTRTVPSGTQSESRSTRAADLSLRPVDTSSLSTRWRSSIPQGRSARTPGLPPCAGLDRRLCRICLFSHGKTSATSAKWPVCAGQSRQPPGMTGLSSWLGVGGNGGLHRPLSCVSPLEPGEKGGGYGLASAMRRGPPGFRSRGVGEPDGSYRERRPRSAAIATA
jgi:hypothetical protein